MVSLLLGSSLGFAGDVFLHAGYLEPADPIDAQVWFSLAPLAEEMTDCPAERGAYTLAADLAPREPLPVTLSDPRQGVAVEALLCVWSEGGPVERRRVQTAVGFGGDVIKLGGTAWSFGYSVASWDFFEELARTCSPESRPCPALLDRESLRPER